MKCTIGFVRFFHQSKYINISNRNTQILNDLIHNSIKTYQYHELYNYLNTDSISYSEIFTVFSKFKDFHIMSFFNLTDFNRNGANNRLYHHIFTYLDESNKHEIINEVYNKLDKSNLNTKLYSHLLASQLHNPLNTNFNNMYTIVNDMIKHNVPFDLKSFSIITTSLNKMNRWFDTLNLIKYLIENNIYLNYSIMNAGIKASGKVNQPKIALSLIVLYKEKGFVINKAVMSSLIITLGYSKHFDLSMELYKSFEYPNDDINIVSIISNHIDKYENSIDLISNISKDIMREINSFKHTTNFMSNLFYENHINLNDDVFKKAINYINDERIKNISLHFSIIVSCHHNNKMDEALSIYETKAYNQILNVEMHRKAASMVLDLCFWNMNYYVGLVIISNLSTKMIDYLLYNQVLKLVGNIPNSCSIECLDSLLTIYPTIDKTITPISKPNNCKVIIDNKPTVIELSNKSKVYQLALNIITNGVSNVFSVHLKSNVVDLHQFYPFTAIILIEYILLQIYHKNVNDIINGLSTYHEDLIIITGRGKHIHSKESVRGVLIKILSHHIKYNIEPTDILTIKLINNDGAISISKENITKWIITKNKLESA